MTDKRIGCYYCFNTLNPKDKQDNLQTFAKCGKCGRIYHKACWHIYEKCLNSNCEYDQVHPVNISQPSSLRPVSKTQAISIRPSTIHILADSQKNTILQLFRSSLLALFFIVIATCIGIFTYRILHLDHISLKAVMDAVFKESLPPVLTIIGASVSGVIFGLVFYSNPHFINHEKTPNNNQHTESEQKDNNTKKTNDAQNAPVGSRRLTYLIAGVITMVAIDLVIFKIIPQDIKKFSINLTPYIETLYAQIATAFISLLLTTLHKRLAPVNIILPSQITRSPFITNIYGLIRLVSITLLINLYVIYLSTYGLLQNMNTPVLISLDFLNFPLTIPMIGAFVSGIAIASIAYWPPKFRQMKWHFGILRLMIVTLSILTLGFMYRSTTNPESLLNAIIIACVATFVATPVQRAVS